MLHYGLLARYYTGRVHVQDSRGVLCGQYLTTAVIHVTPNDPILAERGVCGTCLRVLRNDVQWHWLPAQEFLGLLAERGAINA